MTQPQPRAVSPAKGRRGRGHQDPLGNLHPLRAITLVALFRPGKSQTHTPGIRNITNPASTACVWRRPGRAVARTPYGSRRTSLTTQSTNPAGRSRFPVLLKRRTRVYM
jgi:hypothetical protein